MAEKTVYEKSLELHEKHHGKVEVISKVKKESKKGFVQVGSTKLKEDKVNTREFFVNGKSYTAQMPTQLINGRTLVSEDVLELVGQCIIDCDIEKSTVTITK